VTVRGPARAGNPISRAGYSDAGHPLDAVPPTGFPVPVCQNRT